MFRATTDKTPVIIRIRRGLNGFKYSACDSNGYFLGNFRKLSDIRKHWKIEIKRGQVVLVRELDQMPDMSQIEQTKKNIEKILKECKNNSGIFCALLSGSRFRSLTSK